jgi:hypothetical protein
MKPPRDDSSPKPADAAPERYADLQRRLDQALDDLRRAQAENEMLVGELSAERRNGLRIAQEFEEERELLQREIARLHEELAQASGSAPPPRDSLVVRRPDAKRRESADTVRPPPVQKRSG